MSANSIPPFVFSFCLKGKTKILQPVGSGSFDDSSISFDFFTPTNSLFGVIIFCFDTDTYNPQDFTSENLDDIVEYEPQGGGGTDFECMFKYLKDNEISPKRLVVFTDGYPFGTWGDANYCETVWIVHGNNNPNPPFGQWAIYEEDK